MTFFLVYICQFNISPNISRADIQIASLADVRPWWHAKAKSAQDLFYPYILYIPNAARILLTVALLHSFEAMPLFQILPHPVKQKEDVGQFPLLSAHYPASVMSALARPK